ncbi:MAG: AAA family ATPase [Moraxella sp.]|nr:AAA family ATPase [Moraxella sp.]
MFVLNTEQNQALDKIQEFIFNDDLDVFILRGSAGTGKTTLISQLILRLDQVNCSYALLAPTGRASRILGAKIHSITGNNTNTKTIHSCIYSFEHIQINDNEELSVNDPVLRFIYPLKHDESPVKLLIIDESSMIGDKENKGDVMQFGSGRLLKDIVEFARIGRLGRNDDHTTKILFMGDLAQLPPVGENDSCALSDDYLNKNYQLSVSSFDLTQIMRQAIDSNVLTEATNLKNSINDNNFNHFEIKINDNDIKQLDKIQALEWIVDNIQNKISSVAVVYSNSDALGYNQAIREKLYNRPLLTIQESDLLLINKNSNLHQLSNGDLVKVTHVGNYEERSISLKVKDKQTNITETKHVILKFRNITVAYENHNVGIIYTNCLILENLLDSPDRELSALDQRALYVDLRMRHSGIAPQSLNFKEILKSDPYFNALQVKYGYAITCHKAQGGEWENVLLDFANIKGFNNANFFRWAYTAITRTSKNLLLVNPPQFSSTSSMKWMDIGSKNATTIAPQNQPLEKIHETLQDRWRNLGFQIVDLKHMQYCERYTLNCNNRMIEVQYYYNGKFSISCFEILPNQNLDNILSNQILSAFQDLTNNKQLQNHNDFIQEFLENIDKILKNTNIKIQNHQLLSYKLRITFSDENRMGAIDFNFNGKKQWTSVQEVGGIGATQGLYQEIQQLMIN